MAGLPWQCALWEDFAALFARSCVEQAMVEPTNESPEDFAPTPEHEYQDAHYHDEEPDIVNDEMASHIAKPPVDRKKANRRPPPRRHYEED
jgi:hypothetical protein